MVCQERPNKKIQSMTHPGYTTEEVCRRGEEIYQHTIRKIVEARHSGQFLALDIRTGDYEVGPDDLAATDRLLARKPDAVVYGLRIGFPTAYRIGGRLVVGPV
jgi:hypothetical protein